MLGLIATCLLASSLVSAHGTKYQPVLNARTGKKDIYINAKRDVYTN